jgi:hypothetical protein
LTGALQECRRQIEILRTAGRPLTGNPGDQSQDNRAEIALLETKCLRLKQALADLGMQNV